MRGSDAPERMPLGETIIAIATPPGRGGIGIVRLSGPQALAISTALLQLRGPLTAGRARFGHLLDPETESANDGRSRLVLDEIVATFFAAPRSYTGEDVVEIAAHGAPVVLGAIVEGAVRRGARLAEPGEFTQRAFLSGRLDLTQAEAVHDLIQATTRHQARLAASQLGGALSRELAPVKTSLIALMATLEAGIDFAEDDLEVLAAEEILAQIEAIQMPLAKLEQSFAYGRALRQGATLAIVGQPNAGKSSLFNALLERDRAIVTATPGTTRDVIAERVLIAGVPVELMDTAGMRQATNEIEALGIKRSRETLAEAAIVLLVIDASQSVGEIDEALLAEMADRVVLVTLNKADLASPEALEQMTETLRETGRREAVVATSARTGAGIAELRRAIQGLLIGENASQDSAVLSNVRQHEAIRQALHALAASRDAIRSGIPHEMVLLDLRHSLGALDGLTGQTTSDDILNLIFSTFCIGK